MRDKHKEKLRFRARIKQRIRKKTYGTPERPRLTVFRANNNITAQIVDDVHNKTLVTITSAGKAYDEFKKSHSGKTELSKQVGLDTAEKAKSMNISTVVFDRGGYQYHGRVKALADGARKGGLKF